MTARCPNCLGSPNRTHTDTIRQVLDLLVARCGGPVTLKDFPDNSVYGVFGALSSEGLLYCETRNSPREYTLTMQGLLFLARAGFDVEELGQRLQERMAPPVAGTKARC